MNDDKTAKVDHNKCMACGACVYMCPFGAITDRSFILDVVRMLKGSQKNQNYKMIAIVAPSISSQFTYAKLGQVIAGIHLLGFSEIVEAALGADTPVVRVMPNTPLMLGEGAAQLVKNAAATQEQLDAVRALFDTMGATAVFDEESMLNEVIPYAGSAPAYIYAFADAMVRSAVQHGVPEADALRMFCQTMIGSAKMLLRGDRTPAELIGAVCSPGGTTVEAMKVLESRGLYDILAEACDNCIARAYELGK